MYTFHSDIYSISILSVGLSIFCIWNAVSDEALTQVWWRQSFSIYIIMPFRELAILCSFAEPDMRVFTFNASALKDIMAAQSLLHGEFYGSVNQLLYPDEGFGTYILPLNGNGDDFKCSRTCIYDAFEMYSKEIYVLINAISFNRKLTVL